MALLMVFSRGSCRCDERREEPTCIALFLWKSWLSSALPMRIRMEDAPLKRPSLERASFFQELTKCEMRSWKSWLSILISAMLVR